MSCGVQQSWAGVLMALLTSYVALHKLLNLSETQFPSLQNGNNNVYFSRIDEKLK
jgi:hypothetical protein